MKRKVSLLMTMLLLVLSIVGCGKNNEKESQVNNITDTNSKTNDVDSTVKEKNEKAEVTSKELNLYTWDGMFPQEVLDGFTEETGIKIYYSNFDLNEDMLAKLEATKGGDYDLVICDDYMAELIIKEGLAQKLDKSQIDNFMNINQFYQKQFYDPNDEYTVPYGAGIPLIVYDPAIVPFEITSYEDLWRPELKDNVAIIGNYRVIDGIALKTLGESFNTEDLDVIQKAGDKLLKLAPNIRLINDTNTQDYLISGEVGAAFLYTSQINLALAARPDFKVAYPKEGLGFGIMPSFIPSKAPHADAAHAFLNYILRPEVSAKCFEFLGYYCTNYAAEKYISEDVKDHLILPNNVKRGEIIQNVPQEVDTLLTAIWDKFRNECD